MSDCDAHVDFRQSRAWLSRFRFVARLLEPAPFHNPPQQLATVVLTPVRTLLGQRLPRVQEEGEIGLSQQPCIRIRNGNGRLRARGS